MRAAFCFLLIPTLSPLHFLPLVRRTHLVGFVVGFHAEQTALALPVRDRLKRKKKKEKTASFTRSADTHEPQSGKTTRTSEMPPHQPLRRSSYPAGFPLSCLLRPRSRSTPWRRASAQTSARSSSCARAPSSTCNPAKEEPMRRPREGKKCDASRRATHPLEDVVVHLQKHLV